LPHRHTLSAPPWFNGAPPPAACAAAAARRPPAPVPLLRAACRAALLLTGAAPCAAAAAPPGDPRALHASRSRDSRQPRASVEAAAGFFWASGARGRRKVIEFGTE